MNQGSKKILHRNNNDAYSVSILQRRFSPLTISIILCYVNVARSPYKRWTTSVRTRESTPPQTAIPEGLNDSQHLLASMKSVIITGLGLLGLSAAFPVAPEVERILPAGWQYKIASLRGPGCPDFGVDPENVYATRLTYGQNTMDGSEIYYWFIAYPHLHVDLADNDSSWCETELSYEEYSNYADKTPSADYRLRLHKNGTRAIATYDLEKGTKATITFEYDAGKGKEVSAVRQFPGLLSKVEPICYMFI